MLVTRGPVESFVVVNETGGRPRFQCPGEMVVVGNQFRPKGCYSHSGGYCINTVRGRGRGRCRWSEVCPPWALGEHKISYPTQQCGIPQHATAAARWVCRCLASLIGTRTNMRSHHPSMAHPPTRSPFAPVCPTSHQLTPPRRHLIYELYDLVCKVPLHPATLVPSPPRQLHRTALVVQWAILGSILPSHPGT